MFASSCVQFLPSFLRLSPQALPSVKTSIVGNPHPHPTARSLLSCAGTQTPFPLESNNASIRFLHRVVPAQGPGMQSSTAANRSKHTLTPFPALQYQMDGKQGCSQVQITFCSWVIESHSCEWGQAGTETYRVCLCCYVVVLPLASV